MQRELSKDLLSVLACPDCKSGLKSSKNELKCTKCARVFLIEQGIPILLPKKQ